MIKNWKTSLAGIASIISGVSLFINHPEQISEAIGLVSIGIGLLFSKDFNVSGTDKQSFVGGRPNDR